MSMSATINYQVLKVNLDRYKAIFKFLIFPLSVFLICLAGFGSFVQAQEIEEQKPRPNNSSQVTTCNFEGEWWSYLGEIVLMQFGANVEGVAAYEDTKITGTVNGSVMKGHWMRPPYKSTQGLKGGDIILSLDSDCYSYSGKWRNGTDKAGDDFYGWNKWNAERKPDTKTLEEFKILHEKYFPKTNDVNQSPDDKKVKIKELNRQLDEINASDLQLQEMRSLWKMVSEQIDDQRDKNQNISYLKHNLDSIQTKLQKARKQNVALNKQYGNAEDLKKKIKALEPPPEKKQKTSYFDESTSFPIPFSGLPDIYPYGKKKASSPDIKNKNRLGDVARPSISLPQDLANSVGPDLGWSMYNIKTYTSTEGALPKLEVVEINFSATSVRETLTTMHYPVSLIKTYTGTILWSVNWQNGKLMETKTARIPSDFPSLKQQAEKNKAGAVTKKELDTLINNSLGPNARKKDSP